MLLRARVRVKFGEQTTHIQVVDYPVDIVAKGIFCRKPDSEAEINWYIDIIWLYCDLLSVYVV